MNAPEMYIRAAVEADLPAVLELLGEDAIRNPGELYEPGNRHSAEPKTITDRQRAAMAEIVADPSSLLLLGELADGQVIATAQVDWLRALVFDGGLYCQVEAVRTASTMRGRGYGEQLMRYILDLARERQCARVQLTTNSQRVRAHEFYERLGFVASHVGMKYRLETP